MRKYTDCLTYLDYQNVILCALSVGALSYYFTARWLWALLFIPLYLGFIIRMGLLLKELRQAAGPRA